MSDLEQWKVERVGQSFQDHYASLGYEQMRGSSLLSPALPMTFVMSAGMVQFEKLAPTAQPGDKYVIIQDCFRHVDMEQVGKSSFHLSLFQMPGAFSFGPVDREACIAHIWQLLIQVYGLAPQDLYVTYFRGGQLEKQSFPADEATAAAWRGIGLHASHVIGLGTGDNFWRQSKRMVGLVNSRKCGPNSEVFFDSGIEFGCGKPDCQPGCRCGRFAEFLNALFICYEFDEQKRIVPLKDAFTEVVIGCERVAAILNRYASVYEADTIKPLMQQVTYFSEFMPQGSDLYLRYQRIIVDHVRALLFLIQDDAPNPGKGGQSRLMRVLARELLTCQRLLGISDQGFLRSLTTLALELYPHLTRQTQQRFLAMLANEQMKFEETIQKALMRLEGRLEEGESITPAELVQMEKVMGVPFDLLSYLFWQKHISIDMPAYQSELNAYLQAARDKSD
jgi:alanyl-tRNA synthetase